MDLKELKVLIEESEYITFLGGAGVSTESGIPDFRGEGEGYKTQNGKIQPLEKLLSYGFFIKYPDEFYRFYKSNMIYRDAMPNDAHLALAKLEEQGKLKAIITQNIDGLHQKAGSKNVLELHGSILQNYCMDCKERYSIESVINSDAVVPLCRKCDGVIRPDVVLYGETLDGEVLSRAIEHIKTADMLIAGGSSLVVNPAAGLIDFYRGDRLILINKSPTPYDARADLVINDSISKVLKSVV